MVDDINNDEFNDIIVGIDIFAKDGSEKTIIVRGIQSMQMSDFRYDRIDVDAGKFLLVDTAQFESRDNKDILVFTKSLNVNLILN